jgi:hypothetical protein
VYANETDDPTVELYEVVALTPEIVTAPVLKELLGEYAVPAALVA